MSSLWTPDGEHRVQRPTPGASRGGSEPATRPTPQSAELDDDYDREGPDDAELAALQQELAKAPAAAVIANHAIGLFQLAALHLSQQPANLSEAQLAIDALAALVTSLSGRLGPDEATLRDALTQIRLAYVQIKSETG